MITDRANPGEFNWTMNKIDKPIRDNCFIEIVPFSYMLQSSVRTRRLDSLMRHIQ